MARWTREEEERLLELYETAYMYEEMAGALEDAAKMRLKLSSED